MRMRRAAALAAAAVLLLTGCGDDVKDAVDQAQGKVDQAQGKVDQAQGAVGEATDKARALNDLARVDPEFLKHPDKALDAARDACNFMDTHSDKAKQADEVRRLFD